MAKLPWFSTKGQIFQLLGQFAALCIAAHVAFPSMATNNLLSAGAILFYLLVMVVLISLWKLISTYREVQSEEQVVEGKVIPTRWRDWLAPLLYGVSAALTLYILFLFVGIGRSDLPQSRIQREEVSKVPTKTYSVKDQLAGAKQNQDAKAQTRKEEQQGKIGKEWMEDQERSFVSSLNSFPYSPLILTSNKKRVTIRANSSSYSEAKIISRWFRGASWTVVELADVEDERFADGIRIRAVADNGDAESVHVAFCKLGYQIDRKIDDSLSIDYSLSRDVILEIGKLTSQK